MPDKRKDDYWQGPPPAPPAELVSNDFSCQGTLGLTLRQAITELVAEDQDKDLEGVDNESQTKFLASMVEDTVKSLGRAIATTQQNRLEQRRSSSRPAALLRGRIDHYNRQGSKWRILVHDAEIIRRYPLDRSRRKRELPSLWDVCSDKAALKPDKTESATLKVEVLAYNDLE